jgi:NAD(P)-dependent dehydrogenase (short-subunit alcohol dehydrogenase family)
MPEIAQPMRDLVAKQTGDTRLADLVHMAIGQAHQMGANRGLEDAAAELAARDGAEWALAGVHAGADAAEMVRARQRPVDPPPVDGVRVEPTVYRVSCVPEDHDAALSLTVSVEYRGKDRWAVTRVGHWCLSAAGVWEWEVSADERTDEWLSDHRFPYPEAMRLARQVAPTLTVMGRTVADVLAEETPGAGTP